jgi:hypothetical protein
MKVKSFTQRDEAATKSLNRKGREGRKGKAKNISRECTRINADY